MSDNTTGADIIAKQTEEIATLTGIIKYYLHITGYFKLGSISDPLPLETKPQIDYSRPNINDLTSSQWSSIHNHNHRCSFTNTENTLHGNGYFGFIYDGDFFPKTAYLAVDTTFVYSDIKKDMVPGGYLQVGMQVVISPPAIVPNPIEQFVVEIQEVSGGICAAGKVLRPSNLPIYMNRPSLRNDTINITTNKLNPSPWWSILIVIGLNIETDIQLADDIWIKSLTQPDIIELSLVLSVNGAPVAPPRPCSAICLGENSSKRTQDIFTVVITALRLFKEGDIRRWSHLSIQDSSYVSYSHPFSLSPITNSTLFLDINECIIFKSWFNNFSSISIDPNSIIEKAIYRFNRTYSHDPVQERILDAVIGLETLFSPADQLEVSHRIAQRASFLLSNNPKRRREITDLIKKKAYHIRSKLVHVSTRETTTEKVALLTQQYLRQSIRKILRLRPAIRDSFCKKSENKLRDEFLENLIFYGTLKKSVKASLVKPRKFKKPTGSNNAGSSKNKS